MKKNKQYKSVLHMIWFSTLYPFSFAIKLTYVIFKKKYNKWRNSEKR